MKTSASRPLTMLLLLGGIGLVFASAGCVAAESERRTGYRSHSTGQVQAEVSYEDDYDYYPGYEVFYSRNRREYVYRDGTRWVRRAEPRGISRNVLHASPAVRVDFRDSPERYHESVARRYPRNWKRPDGKGADKDDRHYDNNDRDDQRR